MKMGVGQILVLLRRNALSYAIKHMSAWKSVSYVNRCFLSIHHNQEIYRTWRVPHTKRNLLPFSRILVHRCFLMESVLVIFLVLCVAFALFVIVLCPLSNFACELVFFFILDCSFGFLSLWCHEGVKHVFYWWMNIIIL